MGDAFDLTQAVSEAALRYCVFTAAGDNTVRFPGSGWLDGSVSGLADLVRLVSVPQNAVDQAAAFLEQGIGDAANVFEELHQTGPGVTASIAGLLGMDNVPQTRRMAGAIIANAMIFHDRIAGMHPGIKALNLVCGEEVPDPQGETLSAWAAILNINYWPIFAIGRDILGQLPAEYAARTLRLLRRTAAGVNGAGVDNAHDLTGRVFQRLISDRKYLATFYTLPPSAALLARLAVAKLKPPPPAGESTGKLPPPAGEGWGGGEFDWSDPAAIANLRVGDFACGTGALLSAVYEQVAARHEQAGGDPAAIHPAMMEGSTVRLRRDALGHSHHRLHAVGNAAQHRLRQLPPLHDALRTAGRRQRENRLAGAVAIVVGDDPVQHQRPGDADGQRRRGNGSAGQR